MKIGILGLGLIGGSLAKAYKASSHEVYAYDSDKATLEFAFADGAYDSVLSESNIGNCDAVLLAVYPEACINYLEQMSPYIAKSTLVMDMSGTKRYTCEKGFALAEKYGYTFVGGHPMAGTQFSGFKHASADLFCNAPMVVVPPVYNDIRLFERVKTVLAPVRFGKYSFTTADKHDQLIAFTSQLAHIVSNAYIKSPTALEHDGFSAGSYKDMTRVAWLNETMWSELFLNNKDNLIKEIDYITGFLSEYRAALENNDEASLQSLLRDGRIAKEKIDGNKSDN